MSNTQEKEVISREQEERIYHDMKYPLNTLRSFFKLLKSGLHNEADIDTFIDLVGFYTEHMIGIVDYFSGKGSDKVHNGREKKVINIESFLSILIAGNSGLYEPLGISVNLVTENAPKEIKTYESLLFGIINNLLINAIKFSPNGSEIKILVFVENDNFAIAVKDNGRGIPKSMHDVVFKPYSTTENLHYLGMGLGLANSKDYADALGAKIGLESERFKGATFTLCIPMELCK